MSWRGSIDLPRTDFALIALTTTVLSHIASTVYPLQNCPHSANAKSTAYASFQSISFPRWCLGRREEKAWLLSHHPPIPLTPLASVWMTICCLRGLIMRMPDQCGRSVIHHRRSRLAAVDKRRMAWGWRWERRFKRLKRWRRKGHPSGMTFTQNERKPRRFSSVREWPSQTRLAFVRLQLHGRVYPLVNELPWDWNPVRCLWNRQPNHLSVSWCFLRGPDMMQWYRRTRDLDHWQTRSRPSNERDLCRTPTLKSSVALRWRDWKWMARCVSKWEE